MNLPIKRPSTEIDNFEKSINWKFLRDLPSSQIELIKKIGEEIFTEMSFDNPDSIKYLIIPKGNDMNSTPSPIKDFILSLKQRGKLLRQDTLEFHQIFPGYSPKTQLWTYEDRHYLIVTDPFASYIYCE